MAGVLILAACGGGSNTRPTVAGLAAKLTKAGVECVGLKPNPEVMIARDESTCTSGTETLTIDVFNTNQSRDVGRKLAEGFGVKLVLGDRWAVGADSDETARSVQKALGGTLN